ncbi:tachykinins-like [Adelges cooleyi]|uniref:tachykinins-like n=1 Tax=Adelges cooleyi TaxID=133065 RepID=UPI00217FF354|nr:tachykinins-like [Adelges cooleyi]XP_050433701.1 tachykinins-like [Adelges cooleyi]
MPHKINVVLVMLATVAAVSADSPMNRRASMGFMGMRGKKDQESGGETPAGLELDKRALLFRRPFFEDSRSAAAMAAAATANSAEGFKRAMGFVGMRGKKQYYSKGSPGFFGMRGKKVPSEAFFGVRGKKWPEVDDRDVEQAVMALHKIINNMRSEGERNYVATKFDEEKEMR